MGEICGVTIVFETKPGDARIIETRCFSVSVRAVLAEDSERTNSVRLELIEGAVVCSLAKGIEFLPREEKSGPAVFHRQMVSEIVFW